MGLGAHLRQHVVGQVQAFFAMVAHDTPPRTRSTAHALTRAVAVKCL
jgi:hypothetical protein